MAILTNREKKYLTNNAKMRKQFSAYTTQACILYEYCREYESEKALFERFQNIHVKIKDGYIKMPTSRGRADIFLRGSQQVGAVSINPYNKKDTQGKEKEYGAQVIPVELKYARIRFFNSKLAKISSRKFTVTPRQDKPHQKTLVSKKAPQKNNFELKFDTLYDTMLYHRTVFHELGHSMAKRTVRDFDQVIVRKGTERERATHRNERVVFSGVNPLYSYVSDKNGLNKQITWRNTNMMYLEEGVVENIAMDCLFNEMLFGDSARFRDVDKMLFLNKMQDSVTYYSAYALVGLWNSVSNNELIRQHFGETSRNEELTEATDIFKCMFGDYVKSVVGETYAPKTTGIFTKEKAEKIAINYGKCVDFCKKQYALLNEDSEQKTNLRGFRDCLETATNVDNLVNNMTNYINMNIHEKAEFKDIFVQNLGLNYENSKEAELEKTFNKDLERDAILNRYRSDEVAEEVENKSIFWIDEKDLDKEDEYLRNFEQERAKIDGFSISDRVAKSGALSDEMRLGR